jgi:hypothetical protein
MIPYPDWLPLAQKANKNRSSDVGFRADQPAVGAPIYQKLTDDLKVTWNLTWLFKRGEDRAFEQWLRSPRYLDNGNQWFSMPVNLGGSGLQVQELHFTADGFPVQTSDNGGVITWTGTVITRGVSNPDDQYDDIIVELPPIWWSWLDEIVNRDLPKYVVPPVVPDTSPINLAMASLDSRVNFTRAGAASYVGSNGLILQASANQWPLEYLGGVGRAEPEPASTNVLKFSATVSNAVWAANNSIKTSAQSSPSGGSDAVLWVPSTANSTHYLLQASIPQIALGSTISCYVIAKASGMNVVQICWGGGNTGLSSQYANFDLVSMATSGNASDKAVKDLGNGWRLCSCSTVVTGDMSTLSNYVVGGVPSLATGRLATFAGDGVNGVTFWQNQMEVNPTYSSPIISQATAVTRPAATAAIPTNGASGIKITYSTGETTTLPFGGASSLQIPAATKAWGSRYITLIEYLP